MGGGRKPFFRASVGAVIADAAGRVLALERSDVPGAWQFPQGGIKRGEEPLDAVLREVTEETGIAPAALTLVAEHPEWLSYELPPRSRTRKTGLGQTQRWFLFRYAPDPESIELPEGGEFRAWRWASLEEVRDGVAPFRRGVYHRLVAEFAGRV